MSLILPPPKPLNLKNSRNISSEWKRFHEEWINFEIASEIWTKPDRVRVATFLHVAGGNGLEVYNTFTWANFLVDINPILG